MNIKGWIVFLKKNVEAPINEEIDFFIYAGEIDKITI